MKNKIKLPCGKLCAAKTLCGDCKWLDWSQPTKDSPHWYWCKRISTYKDPELNTACTHWNSDD